MWGIWVCGFNTAVQYWTNDTRGSAPLFAEEIRYFANVNNPALVAAFESVPRDKFIGPGPWKTGLTGFVETPDADPRHVYHNLPISLDESRNLNIVQPGALAVGIDALESKRRTRLSSRRRCRLLRRDTCGSRWTDRRSCGHRSGHGSAIRAQRNLANYTNVTVHAVDGTDFDRAIATQS